LFFIVMSIIFCFYYFILVFFCFFFFFSSRRRHTRSYGDWSSDVCSSDLAVPSLLRGREGGRRRFLLHLRRRARRLSRTERRGEDDNSESAVRAPASHRRSGRGGGLRPPGARPRVPRADHAGDGTEATASLGPAAFRNVPAQPRHLRYSPQAVRRDRGRAHRAFGPGAALGQADAAALSGRAD